MIDAPAAVQDYQGDVEIMLGSSNDRSDDERRLPQGTEYRRFPGR